MLAGCHSRIAQVEYQGQTLYIRILEHQPFIDTSYHIGHRLELKYFHLAQFLLYGRKHLINLRKVKTENFKFRTDLQDQVMCVGQ